MAPTGETAAPGLRERKRARTELELTQATIGLVVERGFDNVTIDDIAEAVEVSKTTFYRYFDSKEEAVLGNVAEKAVRLQVELDERPVGEPTLTAIRNAVMVLVNSYELDRETSLVRGRIINSNPSVLARSLEHQTAWESTIARFVQARLGDAPDAELRCRVVAAIIVGTTRAALDQWRDTDGREDLPTIMEAALAMLAEERSALLATSASISASA